MAVKTACPFCAKAFSAPDEYAGRKVECPRCGRRVLVRSRDEIRREAEEEEKQRASDRERLALIERQERRRKERATRPYYEEYLSGTGGVRHYNPNAPSRSLRLRVLSDLLVLAAYVEAGLSILGMAATFLLWLNGTIPGAMLLVLGLVGWAIVGSALFFALKTTGEVVFLLCDLGDQQNDLVQLLRDLRDNTDSTMGSED